jgi:hypothetical protein
MKPYLEKPSTKIRLVEWLKVKALSSNLSATKKKKASAGPVAHTCNPSHSEVRDQEDHSSKPVLSK